MTLARTMDAKAKNLAINLRKTESELLELLLDMKRRNAFAELAYSGIYSYCEDALKLSPAQSHYFQKVAEKSVEIPQLKAAIDEGKISLSQARRILPVITPQNQSTWIEKAATLKQKPLEKAVMEVNPNARIPQDRIKPVAPKMSELRIVVTEEEEQEILKTQDLLSKKFKRAVGIKEAMVHANRELLKRIDPIQIAERVSSRKPRVAVQQGPARHALRAATKHQLNLRDRGQCIFVSADGRRCQERRWTEFHHKISVAAGGRNDVPNLTTLCSAHHRYHHSKAWAA